MPDLAEVGGVLPLAPTEVAADKGCGGGMEFVLGVPVPVPVVEVVLPPPAPAGVAVLF